jgi:protein TonB
MFGDTLLESSPELRKSKRWPMATAFTAQTIIAAIVVIVPLLSTGVIPLSARVPIYTPVVNSVTVEPERVVVDRNHPSGPANSAPRSTAVVLVSNNPNAIHLGPSVPTTTDPTLATPGFDGPRNMPNLTGTGPATPNVRSDGATSRRPFISVLEEARLVYRVEPVYPKVAVMAGVQGQVKLHAIIARNGTIQSLNAVSGHPLLVRAAMEAVGQWRYRPYILNGEAVEVETFVTVNFKRDGR